MSRRPGNGDCRKGTAGADPQWPVHVCRTRLSETVIARAIAENGARRARSGAARSQNAGPVDHLPAAQPSRFVASSRYLTAACISSASHAGQSSWADNPDTPTLRPAATSPRTARLFTIGITVACGDDCEHNRAAARASYQTASVTMRITVEAAPIGALKHPHIKSGCAETLPTALSAGGGDRDQAEVIAKAMHDGLERVSRSTSRL